MAKMQQQHGERLENTAMLVGMTIHSWGAVRVDQQASRDVADKHGSERKMGQYQKRLLDPKAPEMQRLVTCANALRQEHRFRTLPWEDGGTRILGSKGYFGYTKAVGEMRTKYQEAVTAFLAVYEDSVQQAKQQLGTLFISSEYPTKEQLQAKFGVDIHIYPLPTSDAFRVEGLGGDETEHIKQGIQQQAQEQVQAAMRDVWARLQAVVQHAADRLKCYGTGPDGKIQHGFKDSLVDNIRELLEIVPSLNITNDPALDQFCTQISTEVAGYSAVRLRGDADMRAQVAKAADSILHKMEGYL